MMYIKTETRSAAATAAAVATAYGLPFERVEVIEQALRFQALTPIDTLMFVNVAPSQVLADGFVRWLDEALARERLEEVRAGLATKEMKRAYSPPAKPHITRNSTSARMPPPATIKRVSGE